MTTNASAKPSLPLQGERSLHRGNRIRILSVVLLFLSGMLLGEGIFALLSTDHPPILRTPSPIEFFWVAVLLLLTTLIVLENSRVSEPFARSVAWLRSFQAMLSQINTPLNAESVRPIGMGLVSLLGRSPGWVLFLKVPGILVRGEVMRRQYLEIVSPSVEPWETAEVERLLRDHLEGEEAEWQAILKFPKAAHRKTACWVRKSAQADTGIGLAVIIPRVGSRVVHSPEAMSLFDLGLQAVLLHIDLLMGDMLRRREQLSEEGVGWMVRALVHELSRELQTALNLLAAARSRYKEYDGEVGLLFDLSSYLTRASFWVYLFRDMPFGKDGIPVTTRTVSLAEMLQDCMRETQLSWPSITIRMNRSDWKVVADDRLRSVLRNLLYNAASFCPEGRVTVSIQPVGERISILVQDTGPGLTVDQAENIFRLGVSFDNPQRARGMGVGLYLAREIALAYGGDLLCHPRGKMHPGGCFELLLPLEEEVS